MIPLTAFGAEVLSIERQAMKTIVETERFTFTREIHCIAVEENGNPGVYGLFDEPYCSLEDFAVGFEAAASMFYLPADRA